MLVQNKENKEKEAVLKEEIIIRKMNLEVEKIRKDGCGVGR